MRIDNSIKILEPGDKIRCQNILAEIATVHYQDYDTYTDTFIAEFYDTDGQIRNWHQNSDGGTVIPKPVTKPIYIGFEKQNPKDDDNIHNYEVVKIFNSKRDVIDWIHGNRLRTYKYCGKTGT